MILKPTYQSNPSRTITGLTNQVFNGDTFIICNTTSSAVAINLLELTPGFLNTAYKLYIVDNGNASVNNITINAPVGYTINGLASAVINVNNGVAILTISSNTSYLCQFNFGSGLGNPISVVNEQSPFTPPSTLTSALAKITIKGFQSTNVGNDITFFNDFVTVTFAQLNTLISTNALITNQGYEISNAVYGNETASVFCVATSPNTISNLASGLFYNADYNGVGNYSGIPGFVSQLGVWGATLITPSNSVVIWNNKHYLNITGANGVTNPSLDIVNWQILSNSVTNGYILVSDMVNYDTINNLILSREDQLKNKVTYLKSGSFYSLNLFKWGDLRVQRNIVESSIFYNCNSNFNQFCNNNNLVNSRVFLGDGVNVIGNFNEFSSNYFFNSGISSILYFGDVLTNNTTFVSENKILESVGSINGVGVFRSNNFVNCSITLTNGFQFNLNDFSYSTITFLGGSGSRVANNIVQQSLFQFANNDGNIVQNYLSYSNVTISGTNTGNVNSNTLVADSSVIIQNNLAPGFIGYNTLTNQSSITITDNTGNIGNNSESNYLNNSTINIINNSVDIVLNKMFDSLIQINNINTGVLVGNYLQRNSQIRCDSNSGNFQNLNLFQCNFGSLVFTNITNFINGTYEFGSQSIAITLDCSNPAIYDLATTTLTIPFEYKFFGGIYTLLNANALIITNIINLSTTGEQTILNSPGETTTFTTSAVAGVVGGGELISSLAPTPYNIVLIGRLFGSDEFKVFCKQNVNQVTEVNIFV